MFQKMQPKSAKLRHYSLSRQKSKNFWKDFTQDRTLCTPTLLARWMFLHLWQRHSRLNAGFVSGCWSICRIFSRPAIFFVHINQILANVHKLGLQLCLWNAIRNIVLRDVVLKCRSGQNVSSKQRQGRRDYNNNKK